MFNLVKSQDYQVREEEIAMDPCLLPPEPNHDMDSSVEVVEQQSNHSELSDNVQEILLEAQLNASYKVTLEYLSFHSSRPKNLSNHKLKPVREGLLQGWFQPKQITA